MIIRVVIYVITGSVPQGWTSLIVVVCFMGGIILVSNGVIGIYVGYIFNEVKRRPIYVVRTVLNGREENGEKCMTCNRKEIRK